MSAHCLGRHRRWACMVPRGAAKPVSATLFAALLPETDAFGRIAAHERRRRQPLPPEARPHPLRCVEGRPGQELPRQGPEDRPPARRGLRTGLARQRQRIRQAGPQRRGRLRQGRQARARRGLRPLAQPVERLEPSPARQPPCHRQITLRPRRRQERQGGRPSALHPARRHLARRRARAALFGDRRPPMATPSSIAARTIATSSASSSRPRMRSSSKTCAPTPAI